MIILDIESKTTFYFSVLVKDKIEKIGFVDWIRSIDYL